MDGAIRGADPAASAVAGSPSDAVMMVPSPDYSMTDDIHSSRPLHPSTEQDLPQTKDRPPSLQTDTPSHSPTSTHPSHLSPPNSSNSSRFSVLPPLSPPTSAPASQPSWQQTRSPTSTTPSNPFYSSAYRASTPPIPSSAEQSPIISPAKRFSSGEVKPLLAPTSPRQPLTDGDRVKYTQLATQLKTRLTYAAIKVENGWEKHSFHQIQSLLKDEETKSPTSRRRSHTVQESSRVSDPLHGPPKLPHDGRLTYESFWASQQPRHTQYSQPSYTNPYSTPPNPSLRRHASSQPLFHATFPRRKPERLSLGQTHSARDQSAAEIMIALASPRTRSEFSSPERGQAETDDEVGRESPTPRRKRVELERDVDGLGVHST